MRCPPVSWSGTPRSRASACAASGGIGSTWSSTAPKVASAGTPSASTAHPGHPNSPDGKPSASWALWPKARTRPTRKRKDRSAPTVGLLADQFLAEHVEVKSKDRTFTEYKRLIERVVKPELGRMKVDEVRQSDIEKLHLKYRATPYQANRLVALLSKMWNWSGRRGDKNPCVGVERFAEQKRRRYLSSAELARLGAALVRAEEERLTSPYVIAAVRLLVFTGARLNEILTLRWDHVDLERGWLNLADSKTGAKTIYLNAPARRLLAALPRLEGNPFVVPGERRGQHLVNLEKPWRKIRELAQLPDLRLHDLRHSFASIGAGAGLGLPVIGALLGHAQAATTAPLRPPRLRPAAASG